MKVTRALLVLGMMAALAGCGTFNIVTDPNAYSVKDTTASFKSGQSIALLNGYSSPTPVMVANRLQVDMQQVTDTAIQMTRRALEQKGIQVDPNAQKKVTLKVIRANMYYMAIPFAERWRTNMDMEAAMADGTNTQVHSENSAPVAFRGQIVLQRSVEGATVFAVTSLLNDAKFVGYVNR